MSYWWEGHGEERFWVEIRFAEGTGKELLCPLRQAGGGANAWYDLVGAVQPGDIFYITGTPASIDLSGAPKCLACLLSEGNRNALFL